MFQGNSLVLLVYSDVCIFLFLSATIIWPSCWFLLYLQPGVDIIRQEPFCPLRGNAAPRGFFLIWYPSSTAFCNSTVAQVPRSILSTSVWLHMLLLSSQGLACSSRTHEAHRGKVSLPLERTGKTWWYKYSGAKISTSATPKYWSISCWDGLV